jgi:Ankyrin repeat
LKATVLLLATRFKRPDIIKTYAQNAKFNVRDKEGRTALLNALCGTKEIGADILKLLIENGADVTAVNNLRQGPVHYCALFNRDAEAVRLLLERGAAVDEVDSLAKPLSGMRCTMQTTMILWNSWSIGTQLSEQNGARRRKAWRRELMGCWTRRRRSEEGVSLRKMIKFGYRFAYRVPMKLWLLWRL